MNYRKTTISGLQFGAMQIVNLGNGLSFKKESPHYNSDGSYFFSYTVVDANDSIVEAGSANTLVELKQAAKAAK